MKNIRLVHIAASALCISLALLIAPQPSPAQTEPYEINAILPLTGSGAFLGQAFIQALKLVEKQTNATGGIHGRPCDSCSPTTNRVRRPTCNCSHR